MNKKLYIGDGESALKDLEGTQIGLNIENSIGEGSLAQVNKGVTDSEGIPLTDKKPGNPNYYDSKATGASAIALNVRCNSIGDASVTGGYNAIANTKGDVAFNNSIAGLTQTEFENLYPNGYTLDGVTYEDYEQFCKRVVNGAFACNNGKALGSRSFSAGYHKQDGYGSLADFSATFGNGCVTKFEPGKYDARCSLVGGLSSMIFNPYSIGYGKGLKATDRLVDEQKVPSATFGQFNNFYHSKYTTILEIGNGTDNDNRSNAFEVLFDGRAKLIRKDGHSALNNDDLLIKKEIEDKDTAILNSAKSYADSITNTLQSNINQSLSTKADKAISLSGYGITNAYTKTEVNNLINNLDVSNSLSSETEVTTVVSDVTQTDGKISVTKSPIDAYTKDQTDTEISNHNTSTAAHEDIREKITTLEANSETLTDGTVVALKAKYATSASSAASASYASTTKMNSAWLSGSASTTFDTNSLYLVKVHNVTFILDTSNSGIVYTRTTLDVGVAENVFIYNHNYQFDINTKKLSVWEEMTFIESGGKVSSYDNGELDEEAVDFKYKKL